LSTAWTKPPKQNWVWQNKLKKWALILLNASSIMQNCCSKYLAFKRSLKGCVKET
jgi:hypothetical protein